MEKNYKTFAEITNEDIRDMKARYGEDALSVVTIKGEDEKQARFIIMEPSRAVMDAVGQHGVSKNVLASNKALIANCVLGGDMEVMEKQGSVYSALLAEINKLVKKKEVTVKKL